jgi:hypothetical protein
MHVDDAYDENQMVAIPDGIHLIDQTPFSYIGAHLKRVC